MRVCAQRVKDANETDRTNKEVPSLLYKQRLLDTCSIFHHTRLSPFRFSISLSIGICSLFQNCSQL